MSKLNVQARPRSPITSEPTRIRTIEGGTGYSRDPKSELFLLAVSNMVAEATFYEGADERDLRYRGLCRYVATDDIDWFLRFVFWLRDEGNMRSASIVAAVEGCIALRDRGMAHGRELIAGAIKRADEPGEVLGYYLAQYGRKIPMNIKKGIADAATRVYNEHNFLKWDSDKRAIRFADVIEMTHPTPTGRWQSTLFKQTLDERHGHASDEIAYDLPTLRARARLMAMPVELRRTFIEMQGTAANDLAAAGMTWESLAGWLQGPMDAAAWQAIIPSMGYMALLRNLRNFDDAGVPNNVAEVIGAKLSDPGEVERSRQLPLRFVSAYKAAPSLRWAWALEQAVNLSLSNVPALSGRTLILVDRSGSMFGRKLSERSSLDYAEAAALFGSALALRAVNADLVEFGERSNPVSFRKGDSLLKMPDRFSDNMGSTYTAQALTKNFTGHDRIIIVTDEQAYNSPVLSDKTVPIYTWNLAGYGIGHTLAGKGQAHTFGGLSDKAFTMLALLESRRDAEWPF